jgi:hypothetical protein
MSQENKEKSSRSEDRRRRLAAELKANIGKRKAQARARAASEVSPASHSADRPEKP